MLAADTFFSSQAMLAVVVALVALAAFALGWLLLGTAARVKADRDMAARMAAIGRPVPQQTASAVGKQGSGWIPESVSSFGERFAGIPFGMPTNFTSGPKVSSIAVGPKVPALNGPATNSQNGRKSVNCAFAGL